MSSVPEKERRKPLKVERPEKERPKEKKIKKKPKEEKPKEAPQGPV